MHTFTLAGVWPLHENRMQVSNALPGHCLHLCQGKQGTCRLIDSTELLPMRLSILHPGVMLMDPNNWNPPKYALRPLSV